MTQESWHALLDITAFQAQEHQLLSMEQLEESVLLVRSVWLELSKLIALLVLTTLTLECLNV